MERHKQYRIHNSEKIKKQHGEVHQCVCGKSYTQQHKARHERTKQHQTFVQTNLTNS